jgi:hypothetical protein
MTKRRILNTTSVKKRNGMLSWSNTTSTGASQPVAQGTAFVVAGGAPAYFLFSPTCMNLTAFSGGANLLINQAERTATTVYHRGFSEHLRIQTSSGLPWFHRRICFTIRGITVFQAATDTTPVQTYRPYVDTSNGQERLWFNQTVNNMPLARAAQNALLFKGTVNKDWDDAILAPVDTSRVTLKFDKTWVIKSGNANGTLVERKLWHGMNKNLVYDDDEDGEAEADSYYSVSSKAGMGDYYIMDIIQGGVGGGSGDILNILSNSTQYWHEK